MKTAVIIARFQTPYLHEGHRQLISTVKENHEKLVILLGISPLTGSRKNPYDFYTREKMIKKDYPEIVHIIFNVWFEKEEKFGNIIHKYIYLFYGMG